MIEWIISFVCLMSTPWPSKKFNLISNEYFATLWKIDQPWTPIFARHLIPITCRVFKPPNKKRNFLMPVIFVRSNWDFDRSQTMPNYFWRHGMRLSFSRLSVKSTQHILAILIIHFTHSRVSCENDERLNDEFLMADRKHNKNSPHFLCGIYKAVNEEEKF